MSLAFIKKTYTEINKGRNDHVFTAVLQNESGEQHEYLLKDIKANIKSKKSTIIDVANEFVLSRIYSELLNEDGKAPLYYPTEFIKMNDVQYTASRLHKSHDGSNMVDIEGSYELYRFWETDRIFRHLFAGAIFGKYDVIFNLGFIKDEEGNDILVGYDNEVGTNLYQKPSHKHDGYKHLDNYATKSATVASIFGYSIDYYFSMSRNVVIEYINNNLNDKYIVIDNEKWLADHLAFKAISENNLDLLGEILNGNLLDCVGDDEYYACSKIQELVDGIDEDKIKNTINYLSKTYPDQEWPEVFSLEEIIAGLDSDDAKNRMLNAARFVLTRYEEKKGRISEIIQEEIESFDNSAVSNNLNYMEHFLHNVQVPMLKKLVIALEAGKNPSDIFQMKAIGPRRNCHYYRSVRGLYNKEIPLILGGGSVIGAVLIASIEAQNFSNIQTGNPQISEEHVQMFYLCSSAFGAAFAMLCSQMCRRDLGKLERSETKDEYMGGEHYRRTTIYPIETDHTLLDYKRFDNLSYAMDALAPIITSTALYMSNFSNLTTDKIPVRMQMAVINFVIPVAVAYCRERAIISWVERANPLLIDNSIVEEPHYQAR